VISFDKGGSKQNNKKNKRYRRICLMRGLRNRKLIAVLHRELSFRGDEGDRRISDWVSRG